MVPVEIVIICCWKDKKKSKTIFVGKISLRKLAINIGNKKQNTHIKFIKGLFKNLKKLQKYE